MVTMDERDASARLFQAQLLITEERYNEAGWILDHAADMLEEQKAAGGDLWAYYLYLTTLIHPVYQADGGTGGADLSL